LYHLTHNKLQEIMEKIKSTTIDEYIAEYPAFTQNLLNVLRDRIRVIVPDAEEKISYGVPTFTLAGNLVHFAAYQNHIGFYPGASGINNFTQELAGYETSKGTVQFPLNQPLPLELIEKIVRFRAQENLNKAKNKKI